MPRIKLIPLERKRELKRKTNQRHEANERIRLELQKRRALKRVKRVKLRSTIPMAKIQNGKEI